MGGGVNKNKNSLATQKYICVCVNKQHNELRIYFPC